MKLFNHLRQMSGHTVVSTFITLLLLSALAVPATADLVTWNFNNTTLLYGAASPNPGASAGGATGWFKYDTTAGLITDWNITVPQISDIITQPGAPGAGYTPINPQPFTFSPTASALGNNALALPLLQTINNPSGIGYLDNYLTLRFIGFATQLWNYQNNTLPTQTLETNTLTFSVPLSVTYPYVAGTSPMPQNLTPLGTLPIVTNGPPGYPQGLLTSSLIGLAGAGNPQIMYNIATGQIVSANQASPVPLPDTLFLLASGFSGLIGLKRKYLG